MNTDSSVVLCNLRLLPRKTSLFRVSSTLGLFGLPKKHRRGAENTEFLCAPAVSRGIYLSLPKLGDRQCRELAGLQADLDHRTDDLSARRLHRQCPLEIMSVGLREQLFQQA